MEWVGIVAGFGWAGVVGYLLGLRSQPATRRKPQVEQTDNDLLRLEVKDALDKIEHLYDRIRKRLPESRPAPTPATEVPAFRSGAEVLAEAKRRGLLAS